MERFQEAWGQFEGSFTLSSSADVLSLAGHLLLSGLLASFVGLLFRRCSASPSDVDSISRTFPLLALVTTAVIAVVKSSLALSLGLVGALSIVRFRAAIKDPQELVYLFLCIAIGLAMGAEQPLLAITVVVIASCFVVAARLLRRGPERHRLLLTITGDAQRYFADDAESVLTAVDQVSSKYTLQRFDVEDGTGQVRLVLPEASPQQTVTLINRVRTQLPECDVSYINLNSTL